MARRYWMNRPWTDTVRLAKGQSLRDVVLRFWHPNGFGGPRAYVILSMLIGIVLGLGCDGTRDAATSQPTSQPITPKPVTRTAEKGPMRVTVTADRDQVLMGDPVKLTVHVQVEQGVQAGVAKIEGVLGDFEVKSTSELTPDCPQYMNCAEWEYVLEGVIPGETTIPALPFSFEDGREKADGSKEVYRDELSTEPIEIYVKGSLADLKGPMSVPIPFEYKLLMWAAGTLLLVAAVAMYVRWMRRRAKLGGMAHAEPALPPHEWALGELDKLERERLIERGMIQEYYYRVNGLLRRYIELRFDVMAGEQTSEEFLHMLQDSFALSAPHKAMLQKFTSACDPVKYARQIPDREEIEWVGRSAREFIMQTAPTEADLAAARGLQSEMREAAA